MAILKTYRLNKRIVIESFTITKQTNGEESRSWSTLDTVWANVMYDNSGEDFESNQKVGNSVITFTIRYRSVSQVNRILWDGDYYDILNIDGNKQTRYLNIQAEKKDNG